MNLLDRLPATVMLYKVTLGLAIGTALLLVTNPVDGVDLATRCAEHLMIFMVAITGVTTIEFGYWLLDVLVFKKVNKK